MPATAPTWSGTSSWARTRAPMRWRSIWYNRNLRIFRNIQQLANKGHQRILALFGAGHVQILNRLAESSPEFERIQFGDL